MRPYLVGIAGGTASGKTTLARALVKYAGDERISVVELDSYYSCQKHLSMSERASVNYDHPDTFDFELLVRDLSTIKRGSPIESPVYDFAVHTRRIAEVRPVPVRPVVLVEGILALAVPSVRKVLDLGIFVQAPDSLRLARRLSRDMKERGRTEESVLAQWEASVYPMHQQFCEPSRAHADVEVDGANLSETQTLNLWSLIWDRFLNSPGATLA